MLETILHNRFAVTAVLLFGIGFMNLLLQQNLLKKVVGFNIMDSAVFMPVSYTHLTLPTKRRV